MKKNLLFLLTIGVIAFKAQTYSLSPAKTVSFTAALNDITIEDIFLVNTGTAVISLTWEKISISVPPEWSYSMCDLGTCYPGLPVGPTTMYTVGVGAQGFLGLNMDPGNTPGSGIVKVLAYQSGFKANADTLTWYVTAGAVGIDEISLEKNIKIFPNPTSDYVSINFNQINLLEGKLMNNQGKVIAEIHNSTELAKIDFTNYSTGLYFLNLKTNSGTITKKIIKE